MAAARTYTIVYNVRVGSTESPTTSFKTVTQVVQSNQQAQCCQSVCCVTTRCCVVFVYCITFVHEMSSQNKQQEAMMNDYLKNPYNVGQEPFSARLKKFAYNSDTGALFGRTPSSWGKPLHLSTVCAQSNV